MLLRNDLCTLFFGFKRLSLYLFVCTKGKIQNSRALAFGVQIVVHMLVLIEVKNVNHLTGNYICVFIYGFPNLSLTKSVRTYCFSLFDSNCELTTIIIFRCKHCITIANLDLCTVDIIHWSPSLFKQSIDIFAICWG